jgi:hypothetical protein
MKPVTDIGGLKKYLSRRSAGSVTVRNGVPDARAASAWPSGDTASTVVATKAKME